MRRWLPPVVIALVLLGLWQLAASADVIANALRIEPFLVPAPSDIARSLWTDRSLLVDNGWVTLQEVLAGFAVSIVAGVGFAVVLHLSPTLRRAFYPLLVASQTVPIVVVAPILVVWLGFGIGPKLAIIALICFFPITVNTLDGLRSVDPDLVKMMRTLDAGRWRTLSGVEAPTALPVLLQRCQDRRCGRGDRRGVRGMGWIELGPRAPDPAGIGSAPDGPDLRCGRGAVGPGDRTVRAPGGARAPRGLVGSRGDGRPVTRGKEDDR